MSAKFNLSQPQSLFEIDYYLANPEPFLYLAKGSRMFLLARLCARACVLVTCAHWSACVSDTVRINHTLTYKRSFFLNELVILVRLMRCHPFPPPPPPPFIFLLSSSSTSSQRASQRPGEANDESLLPASCRFERSSPPLLHAEHRRLGGAGWASGGQGRRGSRLHQRRPLPQLQEALLPGL